MPEHFDIETGDHTERFANWIAEVYENKTVDGVAKRLQVALYAEHDIVIRLHERLKSARAIMAEINDKPCEWTHDIDYDSDLWETTCGHTLIWDEGTPKESEYRYCPFCRREIIENETEGGEK